MLIAGNSLFDDYLAALLLIMSEWSSSLNLATRVNRLRSGVGTLPDSTVVKLDASGPDRTVFDDAAKDELKGEHDVDWFFARQDRPAIR